MGDKTNETMFPYVKKNRSRDKKKNEGSAGLTS